MNCSEHPKIIGEHFCIACNKTLCEKCRLKHKKLDGKHAIETYKDAGRDLMASLLEEKEDNDSIFVSEIRKELKKFEEKLISLISDFIKSKKVGKIGKKEEEKMKELNDKGKFAELYCYCKELENKQKKEGSLLADEIQIREKNFNEIKQQTDSFRECLFYKMNQRIALMKNWCGNCEKIIECPVTLQCKHKVCLACVDKAIFDAKEHYNFNKNVVKCYRCKNENKNVDNVMTKYHGSSFFEEGYGRYKFNEETNEIYSAVNEDEDNIYYPEELLAICGCISLDLNDLSQESTIQVLEKLCDFKEITNLSFRGCNFGLNEGKN